MVCLRRCYANCKNETRSRGLVCQSTHPALFPYSLVTAIFSHADSVLVSSNLIYLLISSKPNHHWSHRTLCEHDLAHRLQLAFFSIPRAWLEGCIVWGHQAQDCQETPNQGGVVGNLGTFHLPFIWIFSIENMHPSGMGLWKKFRVYQRLEQTQQSTY